MSDFKTVEGSSIKKMDPLLRQQKEDVSRMRTSLLACNISKESARSALQTINVTRAYHQLNRIIRYTELMDKLEEKLYSSIEYYVDNASPESTATWMMLLNIQEKLQKNMIDSMKLLQPYMDNMQQLTEELTIDVEDNKQKALPFNAETREHLRDSAKRVLMELNAG